VTVFVPDVGDIVWLSLDPRAGREQAGRRPFLVLTPRSYNDRTSLAVGCPITTQVKGYPFEVPLSSNTTIQGVVLADHIKSLDWRERRAELAAKADGGTIGSAKRLISVLLNI
jgi:mRNA interferase MazF